MHKKLVSYSIIIIMLFTVFNSIYYVSSEENDIFVTPDFKYYKKIDIPIDTGLTQAKYQPIDIRIIFNNTCWAKNSEKHSIRIKCLKNNIWYELESQIYDLIHIENNIISECKIVFLIPEYADGSEEYYVFYDDLEKTGPNYDDRVKITDSYEERKPITGIYLRSYYYEITQEGQIIFAIAYDGTSIDDKLCQDVTKLKPNAKDTRYSNGDKLAGFKFIYWFQVKTEDGEWDWVDDPIEADNMLEKKILVDGNLMVKVKIVSISDEKRIKTTNVYTYYYNPTDQKRLKVHMKNEVLKDEFPETQEIDVSYITLSSGGCKSSTISDLNFGCILPYLHVYEEKELIQSFNINTCPTSKKYLLDIHKSLDIDLGSKAWFSIDDGETGKAHAIIFNTTDIVKRGDNERQGIELQHGEQKSVVVPGSLEMITSMSYLGRNIYEDDFEDEEVPGDLIVEFDCEYFITESGGYKLVDKEAELFQILNNYQPSFDTNISDDTEDVDIDTYNISSDVKLGWSFPFGSLFNQILKINVAYITMELCNNDGRVISSGVCERIPIDLERASDIFAESEINTDSKIDIIKSFLSIIKDYFFVKDFRKEVNKIVDIKNATCFKNAEFTNIPAGDYVIKTYVNSPLYNKDGKELVGYYPVENLDENLEISIVCGIPAKMSYKIVDQEDLGVMGSEVHILKDNQTILNNVTDCDGESDFKIPTLISDELQLRTLYKGFIVDEKDININFFNIFKSAVYTSGTDLFDLDVKIFDSDDNPLDDVLIYLNSDDMFEPLDIYPDTQKNGVYSFKNLPKAAYNLIFKYNAFDIKETINVPDQDIFEINLYDLNINLFDKNNLAPDVDINVLVKSDVFEKSLMLNCEKINPGFYRCKNLYPGRYTAIIIFRGYKKEQNLSIPYEESDFLDISFDALYTLSLNIYDKRGEILSDADLEIYRDGFSLKEKISDGKINITLPPGSYNLRISSDNETIAQQKIDLVCDTLQDIISSKRPMTITILFIIFLIIGIILSSYLLIKKDFYSLTILIAIVLVLISAISPWYMINANKENHVDVNSQTNMYLIPAVMVSITTNDDIVGGEISQLPVEFNLVLTAMLILLIISAIFISFYLILYRIKKIKHKPFVIILVLFILISTVGIFYVSTNMLTDVSLGSFFGSGDLDVYIPGEGYYETVHSNWGASFGFYLALASIVILSLLVIYQFKINYKKKKKRFVLKDNLIKYFKKVSPFIGIIILIYLLFDIGFEEIAEVVLKIKPIFIIISAALVIPRVLTGTYIWYYILHKQKIRLKFWKAFKIYLIGIFYGSLTPGYWGRFVIVPYVKDETGEPVGKLFVNTILKSAVTTLSLYTMMIIGSLILVEKIPELLPVTVGIIFFTLGIYLFFMKKERGEKTFNFFINLFVPKKIKKFFTSFVDTFYNDFPDPVIFIVPYILGFVVFFLIYTQIYILSIPLDFNVPFTSFIFLYAIGNVSAFLPISSGGVGVREAALIYIFGLYGVEPATALVVSLGGHLISDVLTGVYGLGVTFIEARNNKKSKKVEKFKRELEKSME